MFRLKIRKFKNYYRINIKLFFLDFTYNKVI